MSDTVYIALGTNLGDRDAQIARAVGCMNNVQGLTITNRSYEIETDPVGGPPQPKYLNAAVEAECDLPPEVLLMVLKGIERDLGRVERERWGPREIDLDIIFFGDTVMETPELTIPHPEAAKRAFVLEPLAEIAPHVVHPVLGKTVAELLAELND